jgi:hypothetical protein
VQDQLPGPVSNQGRDIDDACAQCLGLDFAYPSTNESDRSAQQVVRDRGEGHPDKIGVEHTGGHIRQGTVFLQRIDLLDDRVLPMDLISSDSVETFPVDGGEERTVAEQIEQWVLPGGAFAFDFSLRNPGSGRFVADRLEAFDASPCIIADRCDRCFDLLVLRTVIDTAALASRATFATADE